MLLQARRQAVLPAQGERPESDCQGAENRSRFEAVPCAVLGHLLDGVQINVEFLAVRPRNLIFSFSNLIEEMVRLNL
jgi:hypothetical protein